MNLTTNAVNNTCPIHAEAMEVDSTQPDHSIHLPIDVIPNILRNLPATAIPELSWVCRDWRKIVDNDVFANQMMLPPNANGPQTWREFTKTDTGKAPLLPRWVFKCMRTNNYMLTFIPKSVKIQNEDGTETDVLINSLEVISKLFVHTINGRKIGFSTNAWQPYIQAKITPEEGHWVLIRKKAMGRGLDYSGQVDKAQEIGAIMPDSIETVISLFMEYLRTGEKLPLDEKDLSIYVRVDDKIRRLWLGFVASGFYVTGCCDAHAHDLLAFAPARKFFGL
jgi:F-box associated protein